MPFMALETILELPMLLVTGFAVEVAVFARKINQLLSDFAVTGGTGRFNVFDLTVINFQRFMRLVAFFAVSDTKMSVFLGRMAQATGRDDPFLSRGMSHVAILARQVSSVLASILLNILSRTFVARRTEGIGLIFREVDHRRHVWFMAGDAILITHLRSVPLMAIETREPGFMLLVALFAVELGVFARMAGHLGALFLMTGQTGILDQFGLTVINIQRCMRVMT